MPPVRARVIVLAGPSGAGKSRLADRLDLPVLRLDDFYRSGSDPALPRISSGANAGLVDWDHVDAWVLEDAMAAVVSLCQNGRAEVPVYDIARNGRCGSRLSTSGRTVTSSPRGSSPRRSCPPASSSACSRRPTASPSTAIVTFWRRLVRDLREHRKPPVVLVRRGVALLRDQPAVVARATALGCVQVGPDRALAEIRRRVT